MLYISKLLYDRSFGAGRHLPHIGTLTATRPLATTKFSELAIHNILFRFLGSNDVACPHRLVVSGLVRQIG